LPYQTLNLGSTWPSGKPAASANVNSTADDPATPEKPVTTSFQLPSSRHQAALTGKERAALRAVSETLAKDKGLQRVQVRHPKANSWTHFWWGGTWHRICSDHYLCVAHLSMDNFFSMQLLQQFTCDLQGMDSTANAS
jgi:hypothetical protein